MNHNYYSRGKPREWMNKNTHCLPARLKKKNRFCHLNISDTRSACWRQRHVDRLLSALIKGQLFFGTMAAEAKVRAAQYGLGGWRVASAVNSGQQWGRINRVSCKGVCVYLWEVQVWRAVLGLWTVELCWHTDGHCPGPTSSLPEEIRDGSGGNSVKKLRSLYRMLPRGCTWGEERMKNKPSWMKSSTS